MEILTYKKVYQLVGDDASGTNECITKSAAVEIAQAHRKDITSNLSQYLNNEYIDIFSVEDKPDLSNFSFTNKGYNPQASGNTYTTSVSSRDIDGNTIPYNATSDVDWITNIVINGTEIRFTVSPNIGDQRTGHITGSNATGKSDTITIIQEGKPVVLKVKYHLYVGLSADKINDNTVSLVWQSDQYGESSKKTVYVNAYKEIINESNQVVSTEVVDYNVTSYAPQSKFSVNKNNTLVDFYPLEENTDYSESKDCVFSVSITGQKNKFCTIQLIQDKKGIQLISGDAIMFTYNWDKGNDLDQATFVNLNHPSSSNNNYAGFKGEIIPEYQKFLYFAGDNLGVGNEYAFIDFKSIVKYLKEHGDQASSIDGKTILESLTNKNGIIQVECDLYTNWYGIKKQEDITLSYSVYNKDSEDATVSSEGKQFILKGYTKILDNSDRALCYANGSGNGSGVNRNVKKGYTLVAKFIYYLNSGVFSFETNKDNVGIWNKGHVLTKIYKDVSYSDVQFTNDGINVNLSLSLDSLNEPDWVGKELPVYVTLEMYRVVDKRYFSDLGFIDSTINKLPCKFNINKPLTELSYANFGENQSVEVYPRINTTCIIVNYDRDEQLYFNKIDLTNNTVTISKPST